MGVSLQLENTLTIKSLFIAVVTVQLVAAETTLPQGTTHSPSTTSQHPDVYELLFQLQQKLGSMQTGIIDLTRQVMLQQLYVEEKIRSDGASGLKHIRHHIDGTKPFYGASHVEGSIAAIHEHANNIRTVGMGELNLVMNGVDFRTRHNDYLLRMPSQHTKEYNKLDNIQFPSVPPAVLSKHTVNEQIAEMREWFKAWRDQNHVQRDYRKYFKPVLCYMEGGWTTNTRTLEEPFSSDRHHIDASSWFDLQDKVRFTSYSGGKSNLENYAYLPTTIMNVVNGTPEYAQWNYRIACHPLNNDVPLSAFIPQDDLKERLSSTHNLTEYINSRACRFSLSSNAIVNAHRSPEKNKAYRWGLLDELMYQVPGKDNYGANIVDDPFGLTAYHIRSPTKNMTKLNTGYYHRWYKVNQKDAMGQTVIHRGFADENLFVAATTQPHIAPMKVKSCHKETNSHNHQHVICNDYIHRYTYAIPLEIIYLTPLYEWNPFDLPYHGDASDSEAKIVTMNGRNGDLFPDKALNGTHSKYFYRTPNAFFSGSEVEKDKADTAKGVLGVLDKQGVVRQVVASGTRIFLPNIDGVGKLRTRYPIMPIHGEGSGVWREVAAVKEMLMNMGTFAQLFESQPTSVADSKALLATKVCHFIVPPTTRDPPGLHSHDITLHGDDIEDLKAGHELKGIFTSLANGHQHSIDISYQNGHYIISSCDGLPRCWDDHDTTLLEDINN
ncbi:hypothetical protein CHS0354_025691 [Potamilus streckersoni]|uniref:Uncharacterized protein n=1 Tax=Potamilus streckersoni TaxID=2493646 RepID=A0AAE0S146_9BIVA|nr:hypothetical protein CHS0354_025691 [Potamilus streckersoni]